MKRLALALSCATCVVSCSSTPTVIPTKNMDRPTDMTFVCLGLDPQDGSKLSGRPMSECHVRGESDYDQARQSYANGRRVRGTFAFIPNATRGELAVADMDTGRLLDLGPASAGYSMLPIGGDPESIAATQDGCWVVTANRTTCDFTLVDPARIVLLAETFDRNTLSPITGAGDSVHRIGTVETGTTHSKLHSATGEIAFLPSGGAGTTCGETHPTAVATFPGCDMVAVLDFSFETSTATVRSAYYVRSGRFEDAGNEPVCPVDCATSDSQQGDGESPGLGAQSPDGGSSDGAGAVDAEAPATNGGLRLQALAVEPGGTRIHVASPRDTAITSFDIAGGRLVNPSRFELVDKPAGITRLRLGVDPYATTTLADATVIQGRFLDDNHKFLYAIANDDSIRVVDITGPAPVECDVNVLPTAETSGMPCVPVGTARRRALARGPGLVAPRFTNPDLSPPLPRDIAFANLIPTDTDTNYNALSGAFGFLLASNGQVYPVDTATHSFRDIREIGASTRRDLLLSISPQRAVVVSDQAFASTPSFGASGGPMIKSFASDGAAASWFGFPDPTGMISRSWDVTWEAALPDASRESGVVRSAGTVASSAGALVDLGADFCSSGVRPGDILMFAGCSTDADCQPDNLVSCQVPVSGARGLCLPKDTAARQDLTARPECSRFMSSRLRYEIAAVGPTGLTLNLKLDEVPKTTLNPCQSHDDCRKDSDHTGFECLEIRPQERRCVEQCQKDTDCRPGNVCQSVPGLSAPYDKLCVQAPPLDATCFPQPMTSYTVRAGNSYLVSGTSMPRIRDRKASANGLGCEVVDPGNPELVNRIPFSAPQCPDAFFPWKSASDPQPDVTGVRELSAFSLPQGYNPCLYTDPGDGSAPPTVLAFFENPQIRFALTNLDQYAGDLLSIHFEFQYGFEPLTVTISSYDILLTMPTRILTGPAMTPESPVRSNDAVHITYPYVYVMDQGRTALTPSSRGQVLRINPRSGSSEIPAFDTAISGSTPFQLQ
jgi:hypothetical protein